MRRLLLTATLTLGLISTTATKTLAGGGANCDNFSTQQDAQIFYISNMINVNKGVLDDYYKTLGYTSQEIKEITRNRYDQGNLDADDNGIACEHLPNNTSFATKKSWEWFKYNIKFFKTLGLKEFTIFFNTKPVFKNTTDARFYSSSNGNHYVRVAPKNNGRGVASIRGIF